MKNTLNLLYMATIFMMVAINLSAQPDWSVNPAEFEYTMTVTSVGLFECMETMDENDMVAAFVDNKVHGVQAYNTDVEGRKFAFMIIYDHEISGSEITFKLYNASNDEIFDATNSMTFLEDSRLGDVDNPYKFNTVLNLALLTLTNDTIDHMALRGSIIGEILAINDLDQPVQASYEFVDDSLGTDNSAFSIMGSSLILEEDADIDLKDLYQIHLIATDENGCTVDAMLELVVVDNDIVSTSDQIGINSLQVVIYPNPAADYLIIESEKKLDEIHFYDSSGKLVISYKNLLFKSIIDVASFSDQIYFVQARQGNKKWSGKLIISSGT